MDAFINQVLRTLAAMPPDDVQTVPHDEPMDTDDHDDLPDLQPVSDSDDELYSDSSQDEEEEEEVMMQTVDEENIPPLEPISPPHMTSNRRPRVDDDDDDERDRRHPSQRINNPLDAANPTVAQNLSSINVSAVPPADAAPEGQDNQNQPNQNQPPREPQPQRLRPPIINGFAVTIDVNGQRIVRPLPTINPANPGVGLADFLGFLTALSERETDDPERAKQLVDALEEVPVGLVRRLEALNGKLPNGNGEEDGTGAGDCSCAICWDTLLDGEGGFGVDGDDKTQEGERQHTEGEDATSSPVSTQTSPSQDTAPAPAPKLVSSTDPTQPKIVSLPCAHVFHAACLIPWFSRPRQTTCPTCRFNIDPEKLTARRQPFYPSFDLRNRWAGRQGQQGQAGEQQQQQGEAAPSNEANTDGTGVPTTETQAQAQPTTPANADQPHPQPPRNPGHMHGALPGAVLTIGFDIIIGPNPNPGGHNANHTNLNPDPNLAQNTNMNSDSGADAANTVHNHDHHQHQNQNQNQNVGTTFMDLGMGMGGMGMGMGMGIGGMGDMNEAEIEEVTMMDLNEAQARELGEILRVALPPHPHPHPPRPPPPPAHSATPAPDPGVGPDGGAAQPQQGQEQQHRPAPGLVTGVFTGTGTGRTMGEALAALFSQPLQPRQPGMGPRGNQHQGEQAPGEQVEQGASAGQQGQAEAQAQDVGGQQAGQGPAQMPNVPAFREFLSAVFASMAQAQAQGQRQTRGAGEGAGEGQGAQAQPQSQAQAQAQAQQEAGREGGEVEQEHEHEHEQQQERQQQPQQPQNGNGNALPLGAGGVPGFVLGPLPIVPPAATIGGTPVFNLGNLIAGLDVLGPPVVGGAGGNQANVNNNAGTEANNQANGLDARGTANANATDANANSNAADTNANPNVHAPGPAMNIPFIPFASLFPGATLAPPPAFGMAEPPAQAMQHEQVEEQPAVPQQQPQAVDGSPLSAFMRMLPDVFVPSLNGANGANTPNVPQQQQQPQQPPQQPQQQAGERAMLLPPWARFFQPQLFNPFNLGPTTAGAAQPAQAQAQLEGQHQQAPPGTDGQIPPTGPPRAHRARAPMEKKAWTLPPPPGPTLRQRIEKREREAGFRCYDVSCGIGPSDEEPFAGAALSKMARRQLSIRAVSPGVDEEGEREVLCEHTFHPACLVSAARVANALGEDASVVQGDFVEVGCSVCRGVGSVRREDWDEGVRALA